MAKYTYLHRTVKRVYEIDTALGDDKTKGTTYQDYLEEKWIPVKKTMNTFIKANPTASAKEWIEMELAPLPPPQTLEESKESATEQVTQQAVAQLENLIPLSVIADVIFGQKSEEEIEQLRQEYTSAKTAIIDSLASTSEEIVRAESAEDARTAVVGFNESVRLTVDSSVIRNVTRDSLIVSDKVVDKEIEPLGKEERSDVTGRQGL